MRRAVAASVAALLAACSTARPEDQDRSCVDQDDCLDGQVCSEGFCYDDSALQPRDAIALDVRGDVSAAKFRVELLGNDTLVKSIFDRTPVRYYVDRLAVRDRLILKLEETRALKGPGETGSAVPAAIADLTQASRIGRAAFKVTGLSFPLPDPALEEPPAPEVKQSWPHYDVKDVGNNYPLYVELNYADDLAPPDVMPPPPLWTRGVVVRQLVRKQGDVGAEQPLTIPTVRDCHRKLSGTIRFPEGAPPDPGFPAEMPANVSISLRHAGRPDDGNPATPICDPLPPDGTPATCSPATILGGADIPCTSSAQCPAPYGCYQDPVADKKLCGCLLDEECPQGQVCNVELQRCALDLTDRPATRSVSVDYKDGASVAAAVYTYCDEAPDEDRTMEFVVSAAPDSRLGLPRLSFRVVLDFLSSDVATYLTPTPKYTPLKPICLPTWELAQTIALEIVGEPVTVRREPTDAPLQVCCDTTCFNSDSGAAPGTCAIKAEIEASGTFSIADPALWDSTSCMPLNGADENGEVRVTYPDGNCPADSDTCTISLSAGPLGGGGQTYQLRILPPVGSMFRSTMLDLPVAPGVTQLEMPPLAPRVVIRGKVGLEGCTGDACIEAAEVLAERVIRDEDPSTLLGPYFYTANTIPEAVDFVLPVNPGVYLITALPKISSKNSDIGPSPITVWDLREGSKRLKKEGDVLVADIGELRLRPGAVYTMELDEFDPSSRVIPLDLTSWVGLKHPDGQALDLNASGTCLSGEGCQIRRLRAGNTPVRPTQDQLIRFITRPVPGD